MPSRRAGPATAGPSTTRIVGTTPEQSASALATRPQPSREPIPSVIPVPVDAMTMTSGVPSTRATVAAWARLVDACSDSGMPFAADGVSSPNSTQTTSRLPAAPSSERTSIVAESPVPVRNGRPATVIVVRT